MEPRAADSHTITWTPKRLLYRSMTTAVALCSPLFGVFVYRSIARVRDLALAELDEEEREAALILTTMLVVYFTFSYLLGDPPSLSPIEESEKMLKPNALEDQGPHHGGTLCATLNKALAFPTYLHFGADNGIAIAALTSNNRSIYLGLGIPLTLFSLLHQHASNRQDLEKHSQRFMQTLPMLFTEESILLQLMKEPLRSLEVLIEVFFTVVYYGVSAGYIANQLDLIFSEGDKNTYILPWILSITLLTAYVNCFIKTLTPYTEFFNPAFASLTAEDLENVRLPWRTHALNGGIALIRAGTLGWLSCRLGPDEPVLKGFLSISVCTFAFSHPFYVLYRKEQYEMALLRQQARQALEAPQPRPETEEASESIRLFNQIAQRLETPTLVKAVTVLNVSARIGLSLTFVGFVIDLVQALNANGYDCPLELNDILALSILWSSPIAIQEGRSRQKPLLHSLSYLHAKYKIGAPTAELAESHYLTRVAASFFYSKGQFSPKRLKRVLGKMENATEVEMERLISSEELPSP